MEGVQRFGFNGVPSCPSVSIEKRSLREFCKDLSKTGKKRLIYDTSFIKKGEGGTRRSLSRPAASCLAHRDCRLSEGSLRGKN